MLINYYFEYLPRFNPKALSQSETAIIATGVFNKELVDHHTNSQPSEQEGHILAYDYVPHTDLAGKTILYPANENMNMNCTFWWLTKKTKGINLEMNIIT